MPEFLKPFLRYWSLTLAVFVIYFFAFLAAVVDVVADLQEQVRKKRAAAPARAGPLLDPNPLKGKTIAQTWSSPGQQPDAKRAWVRDHVATVLGELGIAARVLVLEDSKGYPFIQVSNGTRLVTYRVPKDAVTQGRAGDTQKVDAIREYLHRHLAADFLGQEALRPPRTTELAREAAARPAPARPAPAAKRAAGPSPAGGPPADTPPAAQGDPQTQGS